MSGLYAGIDLGGTNIAAGIVNEAGEIIGRANLPARSERDAYEICLDMKKVLMLAVEQSGVSYSQIKQVGIGIPGAVSGNMRDISICNNFRLDGYPVKKTMEKLLEKPVFLENDANAAVYGELLAGAGKNRRNLLMLTLGTGIGSGIIIDGKIFSGGRESGGELGHLGIVHNGYPCTCGRNGCFECYASASGLVRICNEVLQKYEHSLLHKAVRQEKELNGKMIFEAERAGDEAAKYAVKKFLAYLGYGITSCIYIFDPECIIIGGGISNQGEELAERIMISVEQETNMLGILPEIVCAQLGNDAGIIGAAFLGYDMKINI